MKKLLLATVIASITTGAFAHDYTPTEGWPYLFQEFTEGIVYYDNDKAESAALNIHLLSNVLHFTDGENIMMVKDVQHIDSVVINEDVYLRKGNLYVKRMYHTPRMVVGRTCECDVNAINDSSGAYGISTTSAATQNVASFRDHGNMAAMRYQDMINNRQGTSELQTIDRTILVIDDREICQATKNGINGILDKEQKKAFKAFLKENKIKWKELDSLVLVVNFLETIIPVEE